MQDRFGRAPERHGYSVRCAKATFEWKGVSRTIHPSHDPQVCDLAVLQSESPVAMFIATTLIAEIEAEAASDEVTGIGVDG